MQHALLIAEKPSLMREIESIYKKIKSSLNYDIEFLSQRGHLLTQLMPDEMDPGLKSWTWNTLPIHPEQHGGWRFKVTEEKKQGNNLTAKERFEAIKKELKSKKYDFVINAGDPDQEGEALIRETLEFIGNTLPVKRFWTNDLTPKAIEGALQNLKDDDADPMLVNLYAAAKLRSHTDYRYGINGSRAVSMRCNGKVNVGRVKMAILSILAQREDAIRNFKPVTTYGVKVTYEKGFDGVLFNPKEVGDEGDEEKSGIVWFDTKEDAELFARALSDIATVEKVDKKKETTLPPKLFTLASLQTQAGKMGFKADEVLNILQGLYEKQYVSYPRTDCEYLSSNEDFYGILQSLSAVADVAPFIKGISKSDIERVRGTKKWINDAAVSEAGHTALRPTTNIPPFAQLSQGEQIIYALVLKRFIAIFMPAMECNKTTIVADIDGSKFKSTGKTVLVKGYTEILGTNVSDVILPTVTVGEKLPVTSKDVTEKTTTCPKHFSDGELVAACEAPAKYLEDDALKKLGKDLKIGTPATRASIIEEIISSCHYADRFKDGKVERIKITDFGMNIYLNIKHLDICKVDMTGIWEEKLEDVRKGRADAGKTEEDFIAAVNKLVTDVKDMPVVVDLGGEGYSNKGGFGKPVGVCPCCGKNFYQGKTSYYCEGYKDKQCKAGVWMDINGAKITPTILGKLLKGETVELTMLSKTKTDDKGKPVSYKKKVFFDKNTARVEWVQDEQSSGKSTNYDEQATNYTCPKCGGDLTRKGDWINCKCGFKVYLVPCTHKFTDAELDDLFIRGETGKISGLFSKKTGKTFSASFALTEEGSEMKF